MHPGNVCSRPSATPPWSDSLLDPEAPRVTRIRRLRLVVGRHLARVASGLARLGAALSICAFTPLLLTAATEARSLSFEERVRAQRAIEQVYWKHRIWPKENPASKPPLSAVLPDEAIRAEVEDYLAQSNALEKWWQRPIRAAQLQAEMDRMARNTRDSDALQELFDALGNDPYLIAETLARRTLAGRLIRNGYASDERFHGAPRKRAETSLAACRDVACMRSMDAEYEETTWKLQSDRLDASARQTDGGAHRLEADQWMDHLVRLASKLGGRPESLPLGESSGLEETAEAFVVTAVLQQSATEVTTATVKWPKDSFDAWWARERARSVGQVETAPGPYTLPTLVPSQCANDSWSTTSGYLPVGPGGHTAVWTGTEMIVWSSNHYRVAGRYNPSTDTWTATSPGPSIPFVRAVWTGTEMIVWGGYTGSGYLNEGVRYNPSTDAWRATSTGANVPQGRSSHTAVWTGTEMIVWGGFSGGSYLNTGGRYDPSTDAWTATSTSGDAPTGRDLHTAVWENHEMIVWGGRTGNNSITNAGGRYDPSTDTWTATSVGANVPEERTGHSAVWTGTEMVVWGGVSYITGGRYNPSTDTWAATSTGANVPAGRTQHAAVWTGTEMIVWGGSSGGNTGGRYNPSTDTWTATSTGANVPAASYLHTGVWTGTEMIIWGAAADLHTGGRYQPSTDTWTTVSMGAIVPRSGHVAVWTGMEMIVWGGGTAGFGSSLNTGGRYDPATDSWSETATASAPGATGTAVWTGTEMIVWGGFASGFVNTGGRYNPSTGIWTATSTGAYTPLGRLHTAVWTGTEMIVWGSGGLGRYNPSTDTWSAAVGGVNPPETRQTHTAVWTGTEMIIWGGYNFTTGPLNSGGRYNPSTNTWMATSTGANVPPGSYPFPHTAVWTGAEMIVWGGYDYAGGYRSGARYNPSTDAWTPTSTGANQPTGRYDHTAVWTGAEMIVWGGAGNTGGRYDPSMNRWTATSTGANLPEGRGGHTAVWTGTEMIVWGGRGSDYLNSGGRYCVDVNTPTLLSLVSARSQPDRVQLTWYAAGRAEITAVVYRCTVGSAWVAVGEASADGSGWLVYEDTQVAPGVRYGYRLGILESGQEALLGETWVDVPLRTGLALAGLSPNPTDFDFMVGFSLPDASPARLELLDLAGRRIVAREVGMLGPGNHLIRLAEQGGLPAGVYFVRLEHGTRSLTMRGVVAR